MAPSLSDGTSSTKAGGDLRDQLSQMYRGFRTLPESLLANDDSEDNEANDAATANATNETNDSNDSNETNKDNGGQQESRRASRSTHASTHNGSVRETAQNGSLSRSHSSDIPPYTDDQPQAHDDQRSLSSADEADTETLPRGGRKKGG